MYVLASDIVSKPILSIQSGHAVARVSSLMINPDVLDLVALYCYEGGLRKNQAVILMRDIRDIVSDGVIIDSFEDIEDVGEIVRLNAIAEQKFQLIGIPVVTELGHKLGSVEDFTIDTTSHKIQKLYLKQSVLKNLLMNSLVIDRDQIVDVTSQQITVKDATAREEAPALAPQPIPQKPA